MKTLPDEYHTLLPDPNAYLLRLGFTEGEASSILRSAKEAPSDDASRLSLLNDLIWRHQTHIPFENLDICLLHRPISLKIDDLFEKIVLQRRGGYCFELNGLFVQLLEELGFSVRSVLCRIVRGMDTLRPCLHRGIVTELGGRLYFCDVGFGGPMPGGCVLIEDGYREGLHGEVFGVDRADEDWWTLLRKGSEGQCEEAILQFTLLPQSRAEFLPANAYCSGEASVFAGTPMVNLRTDTGHLSLTGNELRITSRGETSSYVLEDRQALSDTLQIRFGLAICPPSF